MADAVVRNIAIVSGHVALRDLENATLPFEVVLLDPNITWLHAEDIVEIEAGASTGLIAVGEEMLTVVRAESITAIVSLPT